MCSAIRRISSVEHMPSGPEGGCCYGLCQGPGFPSPDTASVGGPCASAGWPSLPWPRVAASFNPVIDFFNAGGNGGLPRPELRFTSDIRKTGPGIDDPVPPGRRAFLNLKFCPAMSQGSVPFTGQSPAPPGARCARYQQPSSPLVDESTDQAGKRLMLGTGFASSKKVSELDFGRRSAGRHVGFV